MSTKTTNKELVNFSNNPRSENLINIIDKLLIERLPDLVNEELKWLCEEYGDDEVSGFLDSDEYYLHSPVLNKLIEIYYILF